MIYMDNAATTIHKPEEVKAAVMAAFDTMETREEGRLPLRWTPPG